MTENTNISTNNEKYLIIQESNLIDGLIMHGITHLMFSYRFNQELTLGIIPNSVTHLTFNYNFNQIIITGAIPYSVTHLTFGYCFNQNITPDNIPNSVTHLTFGYKFNKSFIITSKYVYLKFGSQFNQTLDSIPVYNSLSHIWFGFAYNKPINSVLLENTDIELFFHYCYNHIPINRTFNLYLYGISRVTDFHKYSDKYIVEESQKIIEDGIETTNTRLIPKHILCSLPKSARSI